MTLTWGHLQERKREREREREREDQREKKTNKKSGGQPGQREEEEKREHSRACHGRTCLADVRPQAAHQRGKEKKRTQADHQTTKRREEEEKRRKTRKKKERERGGGRAEGPHDKRHRTQKAKKDGALTKKLDGPKSSEAPNSSDAPIQKQIAPKMQKSKDRISEKMADKGASSEKKPKVD